LIYRTVYRFITVYTLQKGSIKALPILYLYHKTITFGCFYIHIFTITLAVPNKRELKVTTFLLF